MRHLSQGWNGIHCQSASFVPILSFLCFLFLIYSAAFQTFCINLNITHFIYIKECTPAHSQVEMRQCAFLLGTLCWCSHISLLTWSCLFLFITNIPTSRLLALSYPIIVVHRDPLLLHSSLSPLPSLFFMPLHLLQALLFLYTHPDFHLITGFHFLWPLSCPFVQLSSFSISCERQNWPCLRVTRLTTVWCYRCKWTGYSSRSLTIQSTTNDKTSRIRTFGTPSSGI